MNKPQTGTANERIGQQAVDLADARKQRDELREALRGALAADTCPCCGRDNSKYYTCTADDCPGRIAIERAGG